MRKNTVTSTYKKTNNNMTKRTDIKEKQIVEIVYREMLDRMDINSKNITLKLYYIKESLRELFE